jgi:DNA-binding MarR family transcriptional regulator
MIVAGHAVHPLSASPLDLHVTQQRTIRSSTTRRRPSPLTNKSTDLHGPKDKRLDALLADFDLLSIVSHLMRRAHFRAEDVFAEAAGHLGLTPRQKALLITVYLHPGSSQTEVADRIAIDANTVAQMISRMIRAGLLSRKHAVDDARVYRLFVSQAGIDVLVRLMPFDRKVEERLVASLPAKYRPLFVKCLKIMAGLDSTR